MFRQRYRLVLFSRHFSPLFDFSQIYKLEQNKFNEENEEIVIKVLEKKHGIKESF